MEKRNVVTFSEAFKQIGKDIRDLKRLGYTGDDLEDKLGEYYIGQCEVCGTWEPLETTGGNGEASLCYHCFNHSQHQDAVEAREIYDNM